MITRIDVWISAFIPGQVAGAIPVRMGPHSGSTAIIGPTGTLFLTDNRGQAASPSASSRMHAFKSIDCTSFGASHRFDPRCDPTVEIEKNSGRELCNKKASTHSIKEALYNARCADAQGNLVITWRFVGAASNGCFLAAPDIDWNVAVEILLNRGHSHATLSVTGVVEPFPAFEMYAQTQSGPVKSIFAVDPLPGSSPWDLWGGPTRNVGGSIVLD